MLTDFQDTKDMTLHKADGRLRDEDERIFATSIRRYERDLSPETISYLNSLLHPELRGLGGIESPVDLPSWATSMGIYIYSVCMYGYVYGRRLIKREARKVA
jgi:hypothetical protein